MLCDTNVPKTTSARHNFPCWILPSTVKMIEKKDRLWKSYKKCHLLSKKDAARKLEKEIKSQIKTDFHNFIKSTEDNVKSDPKKFWSYITSRKGSTRIPGRMTYNDRLLSTSRDIVNAFAEHFSGVFIPSNNSTNDVDHVVTQPSRDDKSCDKACDDNCDKCCDLFPCCYVNVLHRFNITDCDILQAAKKLKPNLTSGDDEIPAFLVRDCIGSLLTPLCHLYNAIISTSTFPECWKIARVTPVFKSDAKDNVINYRPIAIIPNFAKIFRSILVKCDVAAESCVRCRSNSKW